MTLELCSKRNQNPAIVTITKGQDLKKTEKLYKGL